MSVFHDEIEIEDFEYDEEDDIYHYPCPCGDRFEISKVLLLSHLNLLGIKFECVSRKIFCVVKTWPRAPVAL